jgi:hypothetical protein
MVVWTSGFEMGNLSEWSPGINATKAVDAGVIRQNVVVQEDHVYTGKYACEITVHPDDLFGQYVQDRVDIQHQSTLTAEGKDTWISGHYLMLADAGVRNEFAFWETNVSSTNVMDFWVEPKTGGGTTVNFGVGFLGATQLWSADFAIGVWHQVAMHVHWSTNAKLGSVDVWFDGQQVVTAYSFQTKPDGNTLFYQNGLHRKVQEPFVDTIYIDAFIEADTFAEAQIAAPIQPDAGTASTLADDGGAGTDGGAGGSTSGATSGAGEAESGAGATTGAGASGNAGTSGGSMGASAGNAGASTGNTGASGVSASTGAGATGGGGAGAAGGMTGTATPALGGSSGSSSGCGITSRGSPATPLGSALGLAGAALVRRRRRG